MPWARIKDGFRSFKVRELDEPSMYAGINEFWQLYASDVLTTVDDHIWDHLAIDVRGTDESMGVYPQDTKRPPFRVPWANLSILRMGYDYLEIAESDDDGSKSARLDRVYAGMVIEGAKRVDLAKLTGRSEGVLLRFVAYAEDKNPPFLEERIMPV